MAINVSKCDCSCKRGLLGDVQDRSRHCSCRATALGTFDTFWQTHAYRMQTCPCRRYAALCVHHFECVVAGLACHLSSSCAFPTCPASGLTRVDEQSTVAGCPTRVHVSQPRQAVRHVCISRHTWQAAAAHVCLRQLYRFIQDDTSFTCSVCAV